MMRKMETFYTGKMSITPIFELIPGRGLETCRLHHKDED